MMMTNFRALTIWAILYAVCLTAGGSYELRAQDRKPIKYPRTKTVKQVDDYHGVKVEDPYRWLEDDNAEEVKAWVKAQNKVTFDYLKQIPYRDKIRERLETLYNYPRISAPSKVGPYFFFFRNNGLQNQSVLYYQKGKDGKPQVFLDPNTFSEDGTVSLGSISFSNDDQYLAYTVSESGSDWRTIRVMNVITKELLSDKLEWVKFSGVAWHGEGFFYTRYDAPEEGGELSSVNKFAKIYYHKLGTTQEEDQLIYEDPDHPLRYHFPATTEDERFLIISTSEGTHGTQIHVKDLTQPQSDFRLLLKGFEHDYSVVDNVDNRLYIHTNHEAPNYRLIAVDVNRPEPANWQTIIPEEDNLLQGVGTAGGMIFAKYLKNASSMIRQVSFQGKVVREIQLPDIGSVSGFGGDRDETEIYYTFQSFTQPPTIYRYDIPSGRSSLFRKTEVPFNPNDYVTKQVWYESKDGTKVSMFIVHRKGLSLNGQNPTYLYGYGGFNISLTPSFSSLRYALLENGGVFAMANLRGGGEYGEVWHKGGMLDQKQNVFDDFIAAGEYLIEQKYTSSEKLAIAGGSNGGLLVGACMTQRPDLFAVALPSVGVLDMLRFHKFTVGWGWVVEYGSSDDPEQFRFLYDYSPLHNIRKGTEYPATMVMTADHDDRVVPAHSFKFIATLQEKHKGDNPVLIRIQTKAGHGRGKPTSIILDEWADIWSFMFYNTQTKVLY